MPTRVHRCLLCGAVYRDRLDLATFCNACALQLLDERRYVHRCLECGRGYTDCHRAGACCEDCLPRGTQYHSGGHHGFGRTAFRDTVGELLEGMRIVRWGA